MPGLSCSPLPFGNSGQSMSTHAPPPPPPPNSPTSTHLFWKLLASVSSSTGFRLPRQAGEILALCKGQREPVVLQAVEEGLDEG